MAARVETGERIAPPKTSLPYFTVTVNVNGTETVRPFEVATMLTTVVPDGVVTCGAGGVFV